MAPVFYKHLRTHIHTHKSVILNLLKPHSIHLQIFGTYFDLLGNKLQSLILQITLLPTIIHKNIPFSLLACFAELCKVCTKYFCTHQRRWRWRECRTTIADICFRFFFAIFSFMLKMKSRLFNGVDVSCVANIDTLLQRSSDKLRRSDTVSQHTAYEKECEKYAAKIEICW